MIKTKETTSEHYTFTFIDNERMKLYRFEKSIVSSDKYNILSFRLLVWTFNFCPVRKMWSLKWFVFLEKYLCRSKKRQELHSPRTLLLFIFGTLLLKNIGIKMSTNILDEGEVINNVEFFSLHLYHWSISRLDGTYGLVFLVDSVNDFNFKGS